MLQLYQEKYYDCNVRPFQEELQDRIQMDGQEWFPPRRGTFLCLLPQFMVEPRR